jgi:hypothetical protein
MMERRSRKGSSSDGSEKIKLVIDKEKMEGHFSTSQILQRAVAPTEEEKVYFVLIDYLTRILKLMHGELLSSVSVVFFARNKL